MHTDVLPLWLGCFNAPPSVLSLKKSQVEGLYTSGFGMQGAAATKLGLAAIWRFRDLSLRLAVILPLHNRIGKEMLFQKQLRATEVISASLGGSFEHSLRVLFGVYNGS